MKKILNSKIFIILVALFVSFVGTVSAATYLYNSNQVSYESPDSTWDVTTVEQALNSLHAMKEELDIIKNSGDATADNISEGKTAIVKGELITGTGLDIKTQVEKIEGSFSFDYSMPSGGAYAFASVPEGFKTATFTIKRNANYVICGDYLSKWSVTGTFTVNLDGAGCRLQFSNSDFTVVLSDYIE